MAKKERAAPFPKPHDHIEIERSRVDAGMHLFRIHPSAFAGNQFNASTRGDARFSPIIDRKTQQVIPVIYAGDDSDVAICEVIFHDVDVSQRDIVFDQRKLAEKSHSELVLKQALRVAVIDPVSTVKMRAGKKLIHCDAAEYQRTREWAEHIHQQHQDIHGLEWPSRQINGKAWVFFGDRIKDGLLQLRETTPVLKNNTIRGKILRLADRMNITIK